MSLNHGKSRNFILFCSPFLDSFTSHNLLSEFSQNAGIATCATSPSWRSCDERFFWNLNVVSHLIDTPGIDDRWITPITNMWVGCEELEFNMKNSDGKMKNEKFLLTLISRRNRRRQGPR